MSPTYWLPTTNGEHERVDEKTPAREAHEAIGDFVHLDGRGWRIELERPDGSLECAPVPPVYFFHRTRYETAVWPHDLIALAEQLRTSRQPAATALRERLLAMTAIQAARCDLSGSDISLIAWAIEGVTLERGQLSNELDDLRINIHRYLEDHPDGSGT